MVYRDGQVNPRFARAIPATTEHICQAVSLVLDMPLNAGPDDDDPANIKSSQYRISYNLRL